MPPAELGAALRALPRVQHPDLLVGFDWADDAGVFRVSPELALVQTVDFFTPILDDPYDFGRVAAANSLSDVYAMGGVPLTCLNIVCFPNELLEPEVLGQILSGGHAVVHEAGAVICGGHTVTDKELKYGMSVTGTVHPQRVFTNAGAREGDVLVLTKPLGTGVITTAIKKGKAGEDLIRQVTSTMATLNRSAAEAMISLWPRARAATDITGFGLLGHAMQMARASGVCFEFDSAALPLLPDAEDLARRGFLTRGEKVNWTYVGATTDIGPSVSGPRRSLLLDPQTSGGLLICVEEAAASLLTADLRRRGALAAEVVGRVVPGDPGRIRIR